MNREHVAERMKDAVLFWLALAVAALGLVLLALARTDGSDRYTLEGDVLAVHGRDATVQANVTLIAAHLKKGTHVAMPTFWDGDAFVGVATGP